MKGNVIGKFTHLREEDVQLCGPAFHEKVEKLASRCRRMYLNMKKLWLTN